MEVHDLVTDLATGTQDGDQEQTDTDTNTSERRHRRHVVIETPALTFDRPKP
ncbi:hypothetical protein AB0I22_29245 [Streptomyces sp. NPDC050610]|uniref:hypothetical protein n=1 Tax=Streptomyces sp. NPDC050610 TaxID=3157097 RepID=UPI00342E0ADC